MVLVKDPLQAMRVHLSQQTTACYGFPLAPQLLAFQALPGLLAKIPPAHITAIFLKDPTDCANTVTILTVHEILDVEADPNVSLFSILL